ncbi:double-stranded RNA binding motif domain protein [Leptolyngbya sp. NIES-3755]|nr:double-stranded RNA binding motif domain protein [Leptolyngbya sp. NIES-3755]
MKTLSFTKRIQLLELAQFPQDESEIAIAKMIDRCMKTSRKATFSAPVGEVLPQPKQVEPTYIPESHQNPINALQEACQAENDGLPQYSFQACSQGFSCEVNAFGMLATGLGKTKKTAKKDAAISLLEMLKPDKS